MTRDEALTYHNIARIGARWALRKDGHSQDFCDCPHPDCTAVRPVPVARVSFDDLNELDALAKTITRHFTNGAGEDRLLTLAIFALRRKIAALRGETT